MDDITLYLPGILLSYSVFLVGLASPGPNIPAVMGISMMAGRPSGMALATGIATGSLTWGLLTAFGLSALLATYASILVAIKILGGLYLLWLAFNAFRSAAASQDLKARTLAVNSTLASYARRGYLIQMSNPKAAFTWIATISLGLTPGAPIWVAVIIVAGTFILSLLVHNLYAVLFSTPMMLRDYAGARRAIQTFLGAFFTFAGLRLLLART